MKLNFNDIQNDETNNNSREFNTKLFNLKSGETAIVRFLINSTDDFDVYVDHANIEFDDKKYQRINCIREANEPTSKCPLCEAGIPVEQVVYFKMLRYITDENGNVTVEPTIWNRTAKSPFIKDLVQYINTYGGLSNMICSITRTGSGFQDTKYTIAPNLPERMYPSNIYVNDPNAFGDFTILGTLIRDWNYDQMQEFLKTGSNPVHRENNNSQGSYSVNNNQAYYKMPDNVNDEELPFNNSTNTYSNQENNRPNRNMNSFNSVVERPRRSYN